MDKRQSLRQRIANDPDVRAAALASTFAREIGLPPGNLWEPDISRGIAKRIRETDLETAESEYRFRLGLCEETRHLFD